MKVDTAMEYTRETYLSKLVSNMNSNQVKVITGIRRCGKSYLLNTLFKRYLLNSNVPKDHIVQMDFDGFRNKQFRDPATFLSFIDGYITDDSQYYLLLDEVQLLDEFAEVLNDLIRMDNVDIFVTGSNAHLLTKDVITEFRGRGTEIPMRPLSFLEFMEGFKGDRRDGYEEYSMYGGLPIVTQLKSPKEKSEYLENVYEETYIRDIVERNGIRNANDFEDIVNVLCSNIGCLTNPTKISNTFKSVKKSGISRATTENYISYLEDSFLFEKAVRFDVKGRRHIGADAKYYASDLGLRNARMNFRQYEQTHVLENVIYNELRSRGYGVDVGVVPAQCKGKDGKIKRANFEIDFVCNSGSQRYYVQSAFALPTREKVEQEQASLVRVNDYFKKIIITKDGPAPYHNEEGILLLNVYDFLLNPKALEL